MTGSDTHAVEQEILSIARAHFDWIGAAGPDSDLRGDLDLDSLHLIELQVAVEDHFDVVFDPLDEQLVDAFTSVRHLSAYVAHLMHRED
jgi:acyl carrier protein